MQIGVVFPTYEIGTDPEAIKAFGQAADELGFDYLLVYDHVVGSPPQPGRLAYYDETTDFHEPLILSAYLAGVTKRIAFSQGILILPQRQTVLLAKQAAEIDVLSKGRFRLAGGIGYQEFEYEALGVDYQARGARSEEQIIVMRRLWTESVVTFHGRFHRLDAVGIRPLPVQRPIPVWLGGKVDAVLRRAARVADGFAFSPKSKSPGPASIEEASEVLATLRKYLVEAGRDPAQFAFEARVNMCDWRNWLDSKPDVPRTIARTPEACAEALPDWRAMGATHMAFASVDTGFDADGHIEAMRQFMAAYRSNRSNGASAAR
jgi:probable F420-dependent oxidoreductase